jgi:hypothetical protein
VSRLHPEIEIVSYENEVATFKLSTEFEHRGDQMIVLKFRP